MTILLVGVCVDGKIRRNGSWTDPRTGITQWGITDPAPCEKCDGKGCAKEPDAIEGNAS